LSTWNAFAGRRASRRRFHEVLSASWSPCMAVDEMPRFARPIPGELCAHVVTRGNARATIFHSEDDYADFTTLMIGAQRRVPIELFAWCLMPNHVHFVVRPRADGDLARWMHWLLTTHVQRHRVRFKTTGRVWQGRYKAFPIQADNHLLTVLRYVERNPVRANFVRRAPDWAWSSARERRTRGTQTGLLASAPLPLPQPWGVWVDTPLTESELANIRTCVQRDRPLGDAAWMRGVAERLDLLGTFRPRGRLKSL
jgi:putative transposase